MFLFLIFIFFIYCTQTCLHVHNKSAQILKFGFAFHTWSWIQYHTALSQSWVNPIMYQANYAIFTINLSRVPAGHDHKKQVHSKKRKPFVFVSNDKFHVHVIKHLYFKWQLNIFISSDSNLPTVHISLWNFHDVIFLRKWDNHKNLQIQFSHWLLPLPPTFKFNFTHYFILVSKCAKVDDKQIKGHNSPHNQCLLLHLCIIIYNNKNMYLFYDFTVRNTWMSQVTQ